MGFSVGFLGCVWLRNDLWQACDVSRGLGVSIKGELEAIASLVSHLNRSCFPKRRCGLVSKGNDIFHELELVLCL